MENIEKSKAESLIDVIKFFSQIQKLDKSEKIYLSGVLDGLLTKVTKEDLKAEKGA